MSVKREQLLETALRLFSEHGFHATGVDRILAEAGVARMTLYNHFKSKDELILAALRRRDEEFRNWFMRSVEGRADSPKARLLALFDALADWFHGEGPGRQAFLGCTFIKAAGEFCDPSSPEHRAAAEHKALLVRYVRGLAEQAGSDAPERLARELMLLKDGATVMAQVSGDLTAAVLAKEMARPLIEAQLPGAA